VGSWKDWSACSEDCGGGLRTRSRELDVPVQGDGEPCAAPLAELEACNTQACIGDEVCTTKMDLVIVVDASGSLTEKGFDVLKEFTAKIVKRMKDNTHVSVVQFGNGALDKSRIVSDAKIISPLGNNTAKLVGDINKMVWQKGFTNMAQGIFKAKEILGNTPHYRNGAQSAVLVITDGRPSFQFQTTAAVNKLRNGSRLSFAHVQRFRKQDMAELLKKYASDPWESNYIHIKGKNVLKAREDHYVTEVLSELCSTVTSPTAMKAAAEKKAAEKKAAAEAKKALKSASLLMKVAAKPKNAYSFNQRQ
jgi:uncharacterized protein YegL